MVFFQSFFFFFILWGFGRTNVYFISEVIDTGNNWNQADATWNEPISTPIKITIPNVNLSSSNGFCFEIYYRYSLTEANLGRNEPAFTISSIPRLPTLLSYGNPASSNYFRIDLQEEDSSTSSDNKMMGKVEKVVGGTPTSWTFQNDFGSGPTFTTPGAARIEVRPVSTFSYPTPRHFVFCTQSTDTFIYWNEMVETVSLASLPASPLTPPPTPTPFGDLSGIPVPSEIYIGGDTRPNSAFPGYILDLRIWEYMTPSEVKNLDLTYPSRNQLKLIHHWDFVSGSLVDRVTGTKTLTKGSLPLQNTVTYPRLRIPWTDRKFSVLFGSESEIIHWNETNGNELTFTAPTFGTFATLDNTPITSPTTENMIKFLASQRQLCLTGNREFQVTFGSNIDADFTVTVPTPTISSLILPDSLTAIPTIGATITITGTNFGATGNLLTPTNEFVQIDSVPCQNPSVVSQTQITCQTQAGVGINRPISVRLCGSSVSSSLALSYQPPTITSVQFNATERTLTVNGGNFGPSSQDLNTFYQPDSTSFIAIGSEANGFIRVGPSTSSSILSIDHTQIVTEIPQDSSFAGSNIEFFFIRVSIAGQNFTAAIRPGLTTTPPPSSSGSSLLIAAIAGGVGALLVILAIIALIIVIRRRRGYQYKAPFTPVEKKDFTPVIFPNQTSLSNEERRKAGDLDALEKLLIEDDLKLAFTVAKLTQITEADEIAKSLVIIFESHNKTLPLLKAFINQEVETAENAGTLFRSNSMVSKMFKFYSRLIGLPYLYTTVGPEINELIWNKLGLEVDPERMEEGSDLNEMRWTLMAQSQRILKAILNSVDKIPSQFRIIAAEIDKTVKVRFPDNVHKTIGGFIFLRFFCPAVTSPESYGIVEEQPSPESRRLLILITKVLQNLSNNVEFGSKEPYMTKMNDFIVENREKLATFFNKLISNPGNNMVSAAKMPKDAVPESLVSISKHLQNIIDKVEDQSMKAKLKQIISEG